MSMERQMWFDVSGILEACSQQLDSGEMIHTDGFSLYEAMGAVEVMDPRTDAGCGGKRLPDAADLVREGHAPQQIGADAMCAVIDRLISCQVAWFKG